MKIIFSRKGFDSCSGGCPSPIFPDGRMISLPIPDKNSSIRHQDIEFEGHNLGVVVSSLTKGKVRANHFAHLDPDLDKNVLQRKTGWQPVLGQTGAAQGHLRNQNIQCGDVFLFYGLFRDAVGSNGIYQWKQGAIAKHIIWGWMEIGQICPVASLGSPLRDIYDYHPHFSGNRGVNNTLYIARRSGIFRYYSKRLQLTHSGARTPGTWQLPGWMHPEGGRTPLSFHTDKERWTKSGVNLLLKSASRGQEFVLDCAEYPEAEHWLRELLVSCSPISR